MGSAGAIRTGLESFRGRFAELSIWWYALGYFALYVPYSALTKALSDGLVGGARISGFALLPILGAGSMIANWIAISLLGWWRFAGHRRVLGLAVPCPGRWTLAAGLCTGLIIPTTSLAYTFSGVSIVFIMLLMRAGVLVVAPLVDLVSRRRVHWWSWTALALALAALGVGFAGRGWTITGIALANAAVYAAAYFVRLRAMSRITKSDDLPSRMRYFVEEQIVAPPANLVLLALVAAVGAGAPGVETRAGFTTFVEGAPLVVAVAFGAGVLSQLTGVCGTLTLMDARENTFCVPVNRASSVFSGITASLLLWAIAGTRPPAASEYAGAALLVAAMAVLAVAPALARGRVTTAPAGSP